jgi:hypothetical protein
MRKRETLQESKAHIYLVLSWMFLFSNSLPARKSPLLQIWFGHSMSWCAWSWDLVLKPNPTCCLTRWARFSFLTVWAGHARVSEWADLVWEASLCPVGRSRLLTYCSMRFIAVWWIIRDKSFFPLAVECERRCAGSVHAIFTTSWGVLSCM